MAIGRLKFPSAFRAVTGRDAAKAIEWRNERWVVGQEALREPRLISECWATADLVQYYPLFVAATEEKTGKRPNVVLLPLSDWVASRDGFAQYTSDLQQLLGGTTRVIPQGVAGLYHARMTRELSDKSIVVDAGFRTVNLAVINGDDIVAARTHHDEIGVRNLIRGDFREALAVKFPDITHNLIILNQIWQDGVWDTGLMTVSVEEEKRAALARFLTRFVNIIKRDISEMGAQFDSILFIGGLAYYIDVSCIETNKHVILPTNDAEYYNAMGAMEFADADCVLDLGFGDTKVVWSIN